MRISCTLLSTARIDVLLTGICSLWRTFRNGSITLLITDDPGEGVGMRLFKTGARIPSRPTRHLLAVPERKYVFAVDEVLRLVALITTDPVCRCYPLLSQHAH